MKVLTSSNNKGGTGKTLASKVLAEYAAIYLKQRVLLVDLDPQCNLSQRFLEMDIDSEGNHLPPAYDELKNDPDFPKGTSSSADIWMSGNYLPYPTHIENLEILPGAGTDLQDIELVHKEEVKVDIFNRFSAFVEAEKAEGEYDLMIIDTRPSKGPLTSASLFGATHLVIPAIMEEPSIDGLVGMLALRKQINRQRPPSNQLKTVGILPNLFKANTRIHREFYERLPQSHPEIRDNLLKNQIPDYTAYRESMVAGQPSIFERPDSSKAKRAILKVCEEIFAKLEIN